MSYRAFCAFALCCVTLAGCGTGSRLLATAGAGDAATVRLVNASAGALDLAVGGSVSTAHANIGPGSSVACFAVADPTAPGLAVRQAGSTTDLSGFGPLLASGGRFTLLAYPGSTGGIQFATLATTNTAVLSGRSTLRVFDGSVGLGAVDVYVSAPGTALGTPRVLGLTLGNATTALDVAAGATVVRLTNSGTVTVVFDSGTQTLEAGKSYTLVITSATPAAVLVPDC
jgi:hypothetical protein